MGNMHRQAASIHFIQIKRRQGLDARPCSTYKINTRRDSAGIHFQYRRITGLSHFSGGIHINYPHTDFKRCIPDAEHFLRLHMPASQLITLRGIICPLIAYRPLPHGNPRSATGILIVDRVCSAIGIRIDSPLFERTQRIRRDKAHQTGIVTSMPITQQVRTCQHFKDLPAVG